MVIKPPPKFGSVTRAGKAKADAQDTFATPETHPGASRAGNRTGTGSAAAYLAHLQSEVDYLRGELTRANENVAALILELSKANERAVF